MFLLMAAALCAAAPCALADKAAAAAAGVDLDVAYCESTGQQYIDTGILGNPGLRVEAEFMWTDSNPTNDQHVIGSYESQGPRRCYPISVVQSFSSMFNFGSHTHGGWYTYLKGMKYRVVSSFGASSQSFNVYDRDGNELCSKTVSDNYNSVASGQTLYLFALGHNGRANGVAAWTKARIYWLKMYQNNVLVRDYRPACRPNPSGSGYEYGLWEDVNNTFCGSATETPFVSSIPRIMDGKPEYRAQWVDSIGSTQFLDTEVVGRPGTKIEARFQWKSIAANKRLIGTVASGGQLSISCGEGGAMQFYPEGTQTPTTLEGGTYVANVDYTVVAEINANSQMYSVTGPSGTLSTNVAQVAASEGNRTLYVFARSTDVGNTEGASTVRLYSLKIWQDGILVRDFAPGVRDGSGCLYDSVGDKCYFTGNGTIKTADGRVGPPAGTPNYPRYALSYLGSEGNSYFDTGILGNPGLTVIGDVVWTDASPSDDQHILGSFDNSSYGSGVSRRCYAISTYSTRNAALGVGTSNYYPNFKYVTWQRYLVETSFGATSSTLKIDGALKHTANTTFSKVDSGKTLYMFALGHSSQAEGMKAKTKGRVYSVQIYENGSLVRNYIPVIADNGGPYLYDKVTRTFHQGATSGFWDVGEVGERISLGTCIIMR